KYAAQAIPVMQALTESFNSNWGALNEGRKFQGPTNAVNPMNALQAKLDQIMAGARAGMPGGAGAANARINASNSRLQQQFQQQQQKLQQTMAEQLAQEQAAQQLALQQLAAQQAQQLAAQQAQQRAAQQAAARAAQELAARQL